MVTEGSQRYCTECGNELQPQRVFCAGCGVRVRSGGEGTALRVQPAAKEFGAGTASLNSQRSLRIVALILGLIGTGVGGASASVLVWEVGNRPAVDSNIGPVFLVLWMLGLVVICLIGVIGSAISITSPKAASKMLVVSAFLGILLTFGVYIADAIFLGIAAFLLLQSIALERANP